MCLHEEWTIMIENRIALVTGVSSGIRRETARLLAQSGVRVLGTARNPSRTEAIPGVELVGMDVTDGASIEKAVETILQQPGRIDLLVNNAGYGLTGALEE